MKFKIGDRVTCKESKKARYANIFFNPGDGGTIKSITPYVRKIKGNSEIFHCVDFKKNGKEYRTGIDPKNLMRV